MDRHPRRSSQSDKIRKLTILSDDQNAQKRARARSKSFPYCMESIQKLVSITASIGWCHLADPRS